MEVTSCSETFKWQLTSGFTPTWSSRVNSRLQITRVLTHPVSCISESHRNPACHHSFGHPISFCSRKEIPCWSAGSVRSPGCPPEPRALGQLNGGVTEHLRTFDQSHMRSRKLENSPKGETGFVSHVIHNWRSSVHTIRTVNCQCQQDLVRGRYFQPPSSLHLWHFTHISTTIPGYCQLPEGDLQKNEKSPPKHRRPWGTSLDKSPAFQV